ncbi:MAG: hypothetical protein MUE52_18125 [Tabrizicola sp.]|jgi:hypothetical protein|nr:hypothetical protein [Tabrizicola sp.]
MLTRMRLLKGATALLYVGPIFAGVSGLGWGVLFPFVAIFVVWLMILRPEQWPESPEEWRTPAAWMAALAQILSQIALVCILLAFGRGLGAIAGYLPVVNPLFPLAVSFLAIPLCRILWNPEEAAGTGYFLDDEAEEAHAPRIAAAAALAVAPLLNLPDAAPDTEVMQHVRRVMDAPGADFRLRALTAALSRPDRSHAALRRALVLWATEPDIVASGQVPGAMNMAFALCDSNPDLLRLYLPRALALIAAFPHRAEDFPAPDTLRATIMKGSGSNAGSDLPADLLADLTEGIKALAQTVDQVLASATEQSEDRRDLSPRAKARTA